MFASNTSKSRRKASAVQLALENTVTPRPPLKWAGGKRWLVSRLALVWSTLPPETRLVEPFVGGLAVTLGLRPRTAFLNDLSPHLISFYQWLQRGLRLDPSVIRLANDADVYLRNRDRFNSLIRDRKHESAEASMLFYYLNRTCFNGLCRFNARGFFNVPYGRYKTISYREDFSDYAVALKRYEFAYGDFESVQLREGDFVYADPPYDVEFTSYAAGGFSWADQQRLAQWLASHRGPIIASNQATTRMVTLYKRLGFKVQEISAPRRISCNGNRDDAIEMLAIRKLP